MFEVMVLQGLFAVAVIVLEVPSGYFADQYGRRNTLMAASAFATLGITGYSLGYGFLIAETLWAVGVSLISGAGSAMFYDTLIELNQQLIKKNGERPALTTCSQRLLQLSQAD